MSKADLKAREAEASAARDRFMATLHELQHRQHPKTIPPDVKEKAREKADGAMNAAKDGMVQAATHPSTVAAITVPVLVYLFRKPIARGLNTLFGRDAADEPEQQQPQPYEAVRAPAAPAPDPIRAPQRARAEQGA